MEHGHTHEHGHSCGGHHHAHDEVPEEMEAEEEKALLRIINAFKEYRDWAMSFVRKAEYDFMRLEERHQKLLEELVKPQLKWMKMKTCIDLNVLFIEQILTVNQLFENQRATGEEFGKDEAVVPKQADLDKVRSTLKQFVREWSEEGKAERDACFQPLIDEIDALFPHPAINSVRVLVPGSGLGRLPWELARRGYACQGNEFSFFMLLSSSFILNRTGKQQYPIFPFVLQSANVFKSEDPFRLINVPDVPPSDIPEGVDFSMAAGDFLESFPDDDDVYDCVATCFFLDTAKNVVDYVETIHRLLKPGGVWVNIGPLLYHWSEMPGELSIELSWEELKRVIESFGFVIEKEERRLCTYDDDARSMLHSIYNCVLFTATKPLNDNKKEASSSP